MSEAEQESAGLDDPGVSVTPARAVRARTHHVSALALSCHPIPSLGVTVLSAGLAALADDGAARALTFVTTVFIGQLSIGWSNDYLDAARDRSNRRTDKPTATGAIAGSTVARAAGVALGLSLVFAALLGPLAGGATLVLLVCGWAYNLGGKSSWWSWAPYAVGFGSLPVAATLNAPGSRWPAGWAIAAGATLGVAAHLANALPDLSADAATGVRGFPHRIGHRATAVAGPALLMSATALIVFGPQAGVGWTGWCAVGFSLGVGTWAMGAALRGRLSSRYFVATLAVAMLDLLLFSVSGATLT